MFLVTYTRWNEDRKKNLSDTAYEGGFLEDVKIRLIDLKGNIVCFWPKSNGSLASFISANIGAVLFLQVADSANYRGV
jgi:hypothetical protein